jgi:predicted transcriptional regulator
MYDNLPNPAMCGELDRLEISTNKNENLSAEFQINQKQKDRIEETQNEYKYGQTLSEEEANNKIIEWLNEK